MSVIVSLKFHICFLSPRWITEVLQLEDCPWTAFLLTPLLIEEWFPIKLSSTIFEVDGDDSFASSSFHIPASKFQFLTSVIGNFDSGSESICPVSVSLHCYLLSPRPS